MIKIQLKSIFGDVVFEYENSENTIKKTVEAYLKKMKGEIIRHLDLSNLDLSGIEFYNTKFDNTKFDNTTFDNTKFDNTKFDNTTFYNTTFYNTKFDNTTFDNTKFDNTTFYNTKFYNTKFDNTTFDEETVKNIISKNQQFLFENAKDDFFSILLKAIPEIPGLINALKEGKINGSTYSGKCACLVGTIANVKGCAYNDITGIIPNANRPAELWFVRIMPGMTPENSAKVKLTLEWIEEFLSYLPAK